MQMWTIPGLALQAHMSKPYQIDSSPSVTSISCCFWKQNLTLSFVLQLSSSGMSPPPPPEYLPKCGKPRKATRSVFLRPSSLVLEWAHQLMWTNESQVLGLSYNSCMWKRNCLFSKGFSIQRKKWYVMHLTLPWDLIEEASEHLPNTEESRGKRQKTSWREPIISRNNTTSDKQSMFQDNRCLLTAIWQTSKACPTPLSSGNSSSKPTSTPLHSAILPNSKSLGITQFVCVLPIVVLVTAYFLDGNHQTFRGRRIHSKFPYISYLIHHLPLKNLTWEASTVSLPPIICIQKFSCKVSPLVLLKKTISELRLRVRGVCLALLRTLWETGMMNVALVPDPRLGFSFSTFYPFSPAASSLAE